MLTCCLKDGKKKEFFVTFSTFYQNINGKQALFKQKFVKITPKELLISDQGHSMNTIEGSMKEITDLMSKGGCLFGG